MSRAYTPALTVSDSVVVRKIRELPLPGKCLVRKGDRVNADTIVLEAELPGDLTIVRMAEQLGFDSKEVVKHFALSKGHAIEKGQLLVEIPSLFGLLKSRLNAPTTGTIEFFTELNGHLGIRHPSSTLSIDAYIGGTIVDMEEGKSVTIETNAAVIQGIFGVGGERHGVVTVVPVSADEQVELKHLEGMRRKLKGSILVGGSCFSHAAISFASANEVRGIVTASIDATTLAEYVGYEIGVSITGDEDIATTLIVTEGFGRLPMAQRVISLAESLNGQPASLNGATQVRAGATRPEVVVTKQSSESTGTAELAKPLAIGAEIRIIRVPYFGLLGTVKELPKDAEQIPSGAKVRVLRAELQNGSLVTVPRANVELI